MDYEKMWKELAYELAKMRNGEECFYSAAYRMANEEEADGKDPKPAESIAARAYAKAEALKDALEAMFSIEKREEDKKRR